MYLLQTTEKVNAFLLQHVQPPVIVFAYCLVSKNLITHLNELVLLQAGDAEWTTVRVGASRQSNQVDSEVANPFFSIYAL